ncbi:pleiotropic drug resistance protein 1 isoform X2 [Cryptomeria japonica]|uniref:pleiotropic drug resistance protein 1 isoform X2 n=1 Tax=Cryptomeria japonica TaxID=3369 RepID=UPI0027D9DB62|nr:pleiotropic drug resistance protein 1 isoform X2 [Cryptomeria japonica]
MTENQREGGAMEVSSNRHKSAVSRLSWGSLSEVTVVSQTSSLSLKGEEEEQFKSAALHKFPQYSASLALPKVNVRDYERLLHGMRNRIDRVGIELPRIEVRFEDLKVETDIHVGSRALPTIPNSLLNMAEMVLGSLPILGNSKRRLKILDNISGIIKPRRMTLLLGPPGSGKTTLLLALANRLTTDLNVSGSVTYNGQKVDDLVAQRVSAYVGQHDINFGEMTVRETFDFALRCQGFGSQNEMLVELARREKEAGIIPDQDVDTFMKSLGLDVCSDVMVGDEMRRGISGGQKKRVTTGEILTGPAMVLLMDEITTGLDSSTASQVVKHIRQLVQTLDATAVLSLLQPTPETFELFDDIILLSEGHIVYQGPLNHGLEFFSSMGFCCPERKAVADFFQEVISKKDQQQYWADEGQYRYVSVKEFAKAFHSFHVGRKLQTELRVSYDKSKSHPACVTAKYGASNKELFNACFSREYLLFKRNALIHIFKTIQLCLLAIITMTTFFRTRMHHQTITDAGAYLGALYFSLMASLFNGFAELAITIGRLPVLYKQRDLKFYPTWMYSFCSWVLSIPMSLVEAAIWVFTTYYVIGFDPQVTRLFRQFLLYFLVNQFALSLFRLVASVGQTMVVSFTYGSFSMVVILVLGGFILSRDDIKSWWIWGYWTSPLSYAQNAIAVNEFLGKRWGEPVGHGLNRTLGELLLTSRGMFPHDWWYWIGTGAVLGYSILFNVLYTVALALLKPHGKPQSVVSEEALHEMYGNTKGENSHVPEAIVGNDLSTFNGPMMSPANLPKEKQGMVLPFKPLSLCFKQINYYVDMPQEMKQQGVVADQLRLLHDVSGAFRPGILTALVGVSGAGKTTLMDVLAGRKTGGYIEGSINISGYPKKQEQFARVSGYCEQNDIHSPHVTVYESLIYSAWLRLPTEIDEETRKMFVEEVMKLVELSPLRNALVGLPGVTGLSIEQRKRLTIAVELVANPSIVFMDEPTSGLDARSAAIVMRTVRNIVDTGRTIVCTIHQPSMDIFEAFDELLFMKRGGRVIYAGPLGSRSSKLLEYFQSVDGVRKIEKGVNPATWMLEVTSTAEENRLGIDFGEIHQKSRLFQENMAVIESLSTPLKDTEDLHFPTRYSQSFHKQFIACLWKQHWSYWRNPQYTAVRFFFTLSMSLIFGSICWDLGSKRSTQQDLLNALGSMFASVLFIGVTNEMSVQPVVWLERTVFYRERAAGMYSALPYALAQVTIEFPHVFIQAFAYSTVVYFTMGFDWNVGKFLWQFFFFYFGFLSYTLLGMTSVAITSDHNMALVVSVPILMLWILFSGVMISRPRCPPWWKWYFSANPMAWCLYGLISSQYGDIGTSLKMPDGTDLPVKHFVEEYFGYYRHHLGSAGLVMAGFAVMFCFVFGLGIKFLNFQKR